MAIKRNTLSNFVRGFDKLTSVDRIALKAWSLATLEVLAEAQTRAPVASGTLEGSGSFLQARMTRGGVQSAVLFKVPYARKLNKRDADIRLKEVGETSYYVNGTKVTKRRKGLLGFLDRSVDINKGRFTDISKKSVSKAFLGI